MIFSPQHKGMGYAALSGMLYGSLGYFGVCIILQEHASIFAMLFWRFFIASLIFLLAAIPSLKTSKFDLKETLYALTGGALFYVGSAAFYFMASEYIGIGLSMVLFFTYPVMVSLLSWIFHKHKVTSFDYISFSCIIIGIVLLVDLSKITFDIYGIALSILGALCYALYIVLSKKQIKSLSPLFSSLFVSIGSSILFFLLVLWEKSFFIPVLPITWINILGIGIISTALPIFLLLIGLKYISSTKASIVSVLEPIISVIIGVLLLGEVISLLQSIGVVAVLFGALIIQFDKSIRNS